MLFAMRGLLLLCSLFDVINHKTFYNESLFENILSLSFRERVAQVSNLFGKHLLLQIRCAPEFLDNCFSGDFLVSENWACNGSLGIFNTAADTYTIAILILKTSLTADELIVHFTYRVKLV